MAKCDMCDRSCGAGNLQQLLPAYRMPGIVDICPACSSWTTKIKSEMLLEITSRMRFAIAQRKNAPVKPKPSWVPAFLVRGM